MAHGINANLARRWVLQAERRDGGALASAANSAVLAAFATPLRSIRQASCTPPRLAP